jgi:AmiR/NasT family two-component response regulator
MASQRVFVVWANPLFRDSVLALLQHPEVECVGVVQDGQIVPEEILRATPDSILVEEADGHVAAAIMELFEQSEEFQGQLVSFSLRDNRLRVYRREEWTAVQAEDLLHLILQ